MLAPILSPSGACPRHAAGQDWRRDCLQTTFALADQANRLLALITTVGLIGTLIASILSLAGAVVYSRRRNSLGVMPTTFRKLAANDDGVW